MGDVTGCGAVITQGYPLTLADGMSVAYLGSPTSHGGSIVSGNPRVILGVATNTAPVVDFAMAGALDDKGPLEVFLIRWFSFGEQQSYEALIQLESPDEIEEKMKEVAAFWRFKVKPYDHEKEGEDYTLRIESYLERQGDYLAKHGIRYESW